VTSSISGLCKKLGKVKCYQQAAASPITNILVQRGFALSLLATPVEGEV
jgi:hypothetical protein